MKNNPTLPLVPPEPKEEDIREYAFHLYEQSRCEPGHDVDNWLEATACLKANIPAHASQNRLHLYVNGRETRDPLVGSPEAAQREMATLRRGRESLEASPTADDSDVRTSLFDDRP